MLSRRLKKTLLWFCGCQLKPKHLCPPFLGQLSDKEGEQSSKKGGVEGSGKGVCGWKDGAGGLMRGGLANTEEWQ